MVNPAKKRGSYPLLQVTTPKGKGFVCCMKHNLLHNGTSCSFPHFLIVFVNPHHFTFFYHPRFAFFGKTIRKIEV